ncbi:MAG: PilN domain-containing protein [Minisyncoccia bacterium]
MINLLPEKEIKIIKAEIKLKKVFILLNWMVIFLLIFWLFLFSFSIFLEKQKVIIENQILKKEDILKEFFAIESEIKNFNATLFNLNNFEKNKIIISSFFEEFLKITPKDVYFNSINIQKNENSQNPEILIQITGVAKNRETVYEFYNILKGKEEYEDVYFSPQSWFKREYPNFSLTFKFIQK